MMLTTAKRPWQLNKAATAIRVRPELSISRSICQEHDASQVEEKTHPQIETQAQKDAHEIEVIFFSYYYITYQRVSF